MTLRQLLVSTAILAAVAIGMFVYAWQLRQHATLTSPVETTPPVTPPKTGPTEKVTLWVAYDDPGVLRAQAVAVPLSSGRQQQAEQLLRSLMELYTSKASPHPLRPGAEVEDVYLVAPGLAVIDVNAALADSQTSGVLAEELTVTSLMQTLSANIPGLTQFKILVEGKERDTLAGHADLSAVYDALQVADLAKQLSYQ